MILQNKIYIFLLLLLLFFFLLLFLYYKFTKNLKIKFFILVNLLNLLNLLFFLLFFFNFILKSPSSLDVLHYVIGSVNVEGGNESNDLIASADGLTEKKLTDLKGQELTDFVANLEGQKLTNFINSLDDDDLNYLIANLQDQNLADKFVNLKDQALNSIFLQDPFILEKLENQKIIDLNNKKLIDLFASLKEQELKEENLTKFINDLNDKELNQMLQTVEKNLNDLIIQIEDDKGLQDIKNQRLNDFMVNLTDKEDLKDLKIQKLRDLKEQELIDFIVKWKDQEFFDLIVKVEEDIIDFKNQKLDDLKVTFLLDAFKDKELTHFEIKDLEKAKPCTNNYVGIICSSLIIFLVCVFIVK